MGRVWSGIKAQENLLIDEKGGINDAILLAAKDAGIEDVDNINVIEYPKKDIKEEIKNLSGIGIQLFTNNLPVDVKNEYNDLIELMKITEDEVIMTIPHTIEIK